MADPVIDAVAIGRNEGARLIRCLDSLVAAGFRRIVYVDSGSDDGSQDAARQRGVTVVRLDVSQPFTAARARNAGVAALPGGAEAPDFVQFIDGDCELVPGWLPVAAAFLSAHPDAAIACGRRREISAAGLDLQPADRRGMGHAAGPRAVLRRRCADAAARLCPGRRL